LVPRFLDGEALSKMSIGFTSTNQPKCNQSSYNYMRLIVICN
jgi:hypothetical protein